MKTGPLSCQPVMHTSMRLTMPCPFAQCLVKWWAEYPPELLEQRVVQPLQQYLTEELVVTKKLTVGVMNTIKVLAKVEEANQLGRQLPPEAFYNQLIRCARRLQY